MTTGALTAFVILALVQLVWGVAFLLQRRRQKAHQNELVDGISGTPFWRIALARPEHLARWWKLNPVQALGVLVDEGSRIRLRGRWSGSADAFDVALPKDEAHRPTWQGAFSMRAGALAWATYSTPVGEFMVAADTGMQALNSRAALADILRAVYPQLVLPVEARQDFALEKNRWSLATIVAMFALAGFAVLDTYVFSRFELIDAQLFGFVLRPDLIAATVALFLGVGALTFAVLRRHAVPWRESWSLAALVACAAMLALPAALKRVDQTWATAPAYEYRYRVVDRAVTLKPIDPTLDLPTLRFRRAPEYWAQFDVGSEVGIFLLRGALGLWQLDHRRFDPPIIEFYERAGSRKQRLD
jgi:hypothetical protein